MRLKLCILGLLVAGSAFAELDPVAARWLRDIRDGLDTDYAIRTLRVTTDMILPAGAVEEADLASSAVTSNKIAAGSVIYSKLAGLPVGAVTGVTNGQVVALAAGQINRLRSEGAAADKTNTVTLTAFAAADVGKPTYVINVGTTNALRFAGVFASQEHGVAMSNGCMVVAVATNAVYSIR